MIEIKWESYAVTHSHKSTRLKETGASTIVETCLFYRIFFHCYWTLFTVNLNKDNGDGGTGIDDTDSGGGGDMGTDGKDSDGGMDSVGAFQPLEPQNQVLVHNQTLILVHPNQSFHHRHYT